MPGRWNPGNLPDSLESEPRLALVWVALSWALEVAFIHSQGYVGTQGRMITWAQKFEASRTNLLKRSKGQFIFFPETSRLGRVFVTIDVCLLFSLKKEHTRFDKMGTCCGYLNTVFAHNSARSTIRFPQMLLSTVQMQMEPPQHPANLWDQARKRVPCVLEHMMSFLHIGVLLYNNSNGSSCFLRLLS